MQRKKWPRFLAIFMFSLLFPKEVLVLKVHLKNGNKLGHFGGRQPLTSASEFAFSLIMCSGSSGLGGEWGMGVDCGPCGNCGKKNAQKGKKEFHKIRDGKDGDWWNEAARSLHVCFLPLCLGLAFMSSLFPQRLGCVFYEKAWTRVILDALWCSQCNC